MSDSLLLVVVLIPMMLFIGGLLLWMMLGFPGMRSREPEKRYRPF